jgi:hypothetical protein
MLASDNIRLYPGYFIEAVARGIASKQVDTATQIITIRERYKNEFITAYSEAAILDQKLKSKNCCRSHGRARMFYR